MSWSIIETGTRSAVRKVVEANTSIPASVKAVIFDFIDCQPENGANGIAVHTYGHRGGCSSIGKLEIQPVTLRLG